MDISVWRPTISIGLPVFNGMPYLPEAIDSILSQTWQDFELIICDNASTDATPDIMRHYAQRDPRIRLYFNSQNLGAAPNYNRTFELARGDYFKWAAADDIIAPTFLEACLRPLWERNDVVICYPQAELVWDNGLRREPVKPFQLQQDSMAARFIVSARTRRAATLVFGVMRSEALARTGLIGSFPASDEVLRSELAILGKFHEVPETLFFKREHSQTSMRAYKSMHERAAWFASTGARGSVAPRWRLLREYVRAIDRHVESPVERAACYSALLDIVRRTWPKLCKEAIYYAQRAVNEAA